MSLEVAAEDRQWGCRRNVLWQTVPNTGAGDRECSIANGGPTSAAENEWWRRSRAQTSSGFKSCWLAKFVESMTIQYIQSITIIAITKIVCTGCDWYVTCIYYIQILSIIIIFTLLPQIKSIYQWFCINRVVKIQGSQTIMMKILPAKCWQVRRWRDPIAAYQEWFLSDEHCDKSPALKANQFLSFYHISFIVCTVQSSLLLSYQ